jgi:arsenate reductase (glutaredoxin)
MKDQEIRAMNDRVTIYHNPACGTSRNVLAAIRASGVEPQVVEYLQALPGREALRGLLQRSGMSVHDALRVKGTPYRELHLDAPGLAEDDLLEQIAQHPILLNRPFVESAQGVRLCRPSDLVLTLLPRLPAEVAKEDGTPFLLERQVEASDPGLRQALVAAGLPVDDLAEAGRVFCAYSTLNGDLAGYGGFEHYGREVLLRSIVVAPAQRGRGIGRGIVPLLMRRAFDAGARQAWLLTTSAAEFFGHLGFKPVERAQVPAAILGTRQAASLCPAEAVILSRSISL